MRKNILFLSVFLTAFYYVNSSYAASCSKANLTKCLDSVCAINISMNPGARCQYCGSADAGSATSKLKSVSTGSSSKTSISAKELKNAPTDPGERYVWATKKCLEKIVDCTTDDVSDTYDQLIEQSCMAAGITAQIANLSEKSKKEKNESSCESEINACITADNACGADYSKCKTSADFDNYFASCSVQATSCEKHLASIKQKLSSNKSSALANIDKAIDNIINSYKATREANLVKAKQSCTNNSGRDSCIESVCSANMPHKCDKGYESERSMATLLCKFYDTACATLK